MLTKNRMMGIVSSAAISPNLHRGSIRRRANQTRWASLGASLQLREIHTLTSEAPVERTARPSYSCKLYAASAT